MRCEICQKGDYQAVYQGKIRNGKVGNYIDGEILGCPVCKIQRLPEYLCIPEESYNDESYRKHVGESTDIQEYIKNHDHEQLDHLIACRRLGVNFRNKSVLDVGAGAGLFLDWIRGIVSKCGAVEPCEHFHTYLENTCYEFCYVYKHIHNIVDKFRVIVSFVTIEHVKDPVLFLSEMKDVLADDGVIVISTPNLRADPTWSLRPEFRNENFYRTQHRWYFNMQSLTYAMLKAGLARLDKIDEKYLYVACKADSK